MAWFMDLGSNENHSPVYNFALQLQNFVLCGMYATKFHNLMSNIIDNRGLSQYKDVLSV